LAFLFNEAIDQALAESVGRYARAVFFEGAPHNAMFVVWELRESCIESFSPTRLEWATASQARYATQGDSGSALQLSPGNWPSETYIESATILV
jgi:hypothetical protein